MTLPLGLTSFGNLTVPTTPPEPPPEPALATRGLECLLTVWEKTIDLQMHFNDLCLSLRRTAVTVLGALLGAGALSFRFGGFVVIGNQTTTTAFLFSILGLIVWCVFYFIDRFWYHELLRASVSYAESLEGEAKKLGLPFRLDVSRRIREKNRASLNLTGASKLDLFYVVPAAILLAVSFVLFRGFIQPLG